MTQVLVRSARILDALARRPLWRLGELASRVDLPPATCSRLLATLVELDWAERIAPRGPYRLGPRLLALADRRPLADHLLTAVRPRLERIARELAQPTVLVRLRGERRHVVLLRAPAAAGTADLPTEDRDLYVTATGRLLLAHLERRRRDRLIERLGLPARRDWPGILTRSELLAELRALRRAGHARHDTADWHSVAAWIGEWGGEGAAIGTFAPPGALHPDSREILRRTAAELT